MHCCTLSSLSLAAQRYNLHEAATALEDAVAGGGETVAPELDAGGDFVDDDDDDFDDDDDDDEVAAAESDESANEYPY